MINLIIYVELLIRILKRTVSQFPKDRVSEQHPSIVNWSNIVSIFQWDILYSVSYSISYAIALEGTQWRHYSFFTGSIAGMSLAANIYTIYKQWYAVDTYREQKESGALFWYTPPMGKWAMICEKHWGLVWLSQIKSLHS